MIKTTLSLTLLTLLIPYHALSCEVTRLDAYDATIFEEGARIHAYTKTILSESEAKCYEELAEKICKENPEVTAMTNCEVITDTNPQHMLMHTTKKKITINSTNPKIT